MNEDVVSLKSRLLEGMRDYMEACLKAGNSPGYSEKQIDECRKILDDFLAALSAAPQRDEETTMAVVRDTVLALNALNDECDGSLIETDQREVLAPLIIKAAQAVGLGNGEDITEEWREW